MGYAKIVSGGPTGRYTIELDFGAAQRTAALAQLATATSTLASKRASTEAQIAAQEALLVPMRAARQAAVDAYIAAADALRLTGRLPPGSPTLDTKAIDFQTAQIQNAEIKIQPLRRQLDAIKFMQANAAREVARWNNLVAISTRQAWCTTLKEDAPAGSYVATCDIPGDSNLVLLAPECRPWIPGDGKITPQKQADALAKINARLSTIQARLAAVDAAVVAGDAEIVTLKVQLATVTAAYAADPIATPQAVVSAAALALAKKQREVVDLRIKRGPLSLRVRRGQLLLARYSLYGTTANPVAGDGYLRARGVMSPEQAFYNVATLPGVQKWKPTYRWGTATSINYDADTMTVSLFDQRSTEQSLSVNQASTLTNVPVVYMTCNAEAFAPGDRVVVQFLDQDWKKPRVIGFLDNPKPCGAWPTISVIVTFESDLGASPGSANEIISFGDSSCGQLVTQAVDNRQLGPPATHRLRIHSHLVNGPAESGRTLNSSEADGTVVWTASSSNNLYGASGGIPHAGAGNSIAFISREGGTHTLWETTTNGTPMNIPGGYFGGCVVAFMYAGIYSTYSFSRPFVGISPHHWLEELGRMPAISLTRGGVTKAYEFSHGDSYAALPGFGDTFDPLNVAYQIIFKKVDEP